MTLNTHNLQGGELNPISWVSPAILKTFYSGAIESVLTQCISVWYGNASNQDCKALQRVVRLAERISGSALPSFQDIYIKLGMHRSDKLHRYRLRSSHFLRIQIRSCAFKLILFCVVVKSQGSHKNIIKHHKVFAHYISSVLELFHSLI